jgi:hypothetical protein
MKVHLCLSQPKEVADEANFEKLGVQILFQAEHMHDSMLAECEQICVAVLAELMRVCMYVCVCCLNIICIVRERLFLLSVKVQQQWRWIKQCICLS